MPDIVEICNTVEITWMTLFHKQRTSAVFELGWVQDSERVSSYCGKLC